MTRPPPWLVSSLVAALLCPVAAPDAAGEEKPPKATPGDGGPVAEPEVEPDLEPDPQCLQWLGDREIRFTAAPATRGVRTPVVITGPLDGVKLVPTGKRPALMDCELARALHEGGEIFRELGIDVLTYSAAYDYRTRRDSAKLSNHSHGLAIDVHLFSGHRVDREFEPGVGQWRSLSRGPAMSLEECIGAPVTDEGRLLRTLACRLKLHPAFRVIVTLDDNEDHRSHFHLEAYGDLSDRGHRFHSQPKPAPGPVAGWATLNPPTDGGTTPSPTSAKAKSKATRKKRSKRLAAKKAKAKAEAKAKAKAKAKTKAKADPKTKTKVTSREAPGKR